MGRAWFNVLLLPSGILNNSLTRVLCFHFVLHPENSGVFTSMAQSLVFCPSLLSSLGAFLQTQYKEGCSTQSKPRQSSPHLLLPLSQHGPWAPLAIPGWGWLALRTAEVGLCTPSPFPCPRVWNFHPTTGLGTVLEPPV